MSCNLERREYMFAIWNIIFLELPKRNIFALFAFTVKREGKEKEHIYTWQDHMTNQWLQLFTWSDEDNFICMQHAEICQLAPRHHFILAQLNQFGCLKLLNRRKLFFYESKKSKISLLNRAGSSIWGTWPVFSKICILTFSPKHLPPVLMHQDGYEIYVL